MMLAVSSEEAQRLDVGWAWLYTSLLYHPGLPFGFAYMHRSCFARTYLAILLAHPIVLEGDKSS